MLLHHSLCFLTITLGLPRNTTLLFIYTEEIIFLYLKRTIQITRKGMKMPRSKFLRALVSFSLFATMFALGGVPAVHAAPTTYTVTFDGNGADSGSTLPQTSAAPASLNVNQYILAGYLFDGWSSSPTGVVEYTDQATYDFTASITLYAQWTALPDHTVVFDANGGSGTMSDQVDSIFTTLTTNTFSRTGYTFTGWNTDASAGDQGIVYEDAGGFDFSAGGATLYAQWIIDSFMVTYNDNHSTGGTVPTDVVSHDYDTSVTVKANTGSLVRTGYTFNGWNTQAGGAGTSYTATGSDSFTISDHVTLYVNWAVNHTVTFNPNTGSGAMPDQTSGIAATLTSNTFTKTGYTFTGWATSVGGSVVYADGANYNFGADATLYAQWTALANHTVTFDANGGTGTRGYQFANVATALTANIFTKSGFAFTGWNTAAGGTGDAYADSAN